MAQIAASDEAREHLYGAEYPVSARSRVSGGWQDCAAEKRYGRQDSIELSKMAGRVADLDFLATILPNCDPAPACEPNRSRCVNLCANPNLSDRDTI